MYKILNFKSFYRPKCLILRCITFTSKLNFEPGKRTTVDKESMRHNFVPCCEPIMTKITDSMEPLRIAENIPQPKVAIIGAGMAGLSAAAALIHGGIKNVVVLEAKSRPGGRIHSCKLGDDVVELGADFIEGGSVANPIYNLACMGRVILCSPKRYLSIPDQFITTDGRIIIPNSEIHYTIQNILEEAAGVFVSCDPKTEKRSLYQFLKNKLENVAKGLNEQDVHDFTLVSNGILNELRGRWGVDLSFISLEQYGSDICIPGGRISIPMGAQTLLDPLLSVIQGSSMKFNKPVQCIRWGTSLMSDPRALIQCCDGSEESADYVICTVSLGVIKEQAETFFSPVLPDYKLDAVNHLGFGCINKIFLEYAKPFWLKCQGTKLKIAWTTKQLNSRDNWVKGISLIEEVQGRGNVIMCTVSGKEALWTETLTDSQVADELTIFLRKVTGDSTIPCPIGINRSKWGSDVHFCGSRTYMKLDSLVRHSCDLAVPLPGPCHDVPPILLFAGDSTCPGHSSSMQGARLSGLREAHRIIGLTRKFGGPPKPPTVGPTKYGPCIDPEDSDDPKLCKEVECFNETEETEKKEKEKSVPAK